MSAQEERPEPQMTMRVSRDGGRTYGEPVRVWAGETDGPHDPLLWPPCQCPKHRAKGETP